MNIIEWNESSWTKLEERLKARTTPSPQLKTVRAIIQSVRERGDRALREFTLKFDNADVRSLRVSGAEIRSARKVLTPELKRAFERAEGNIKRYCSRGLQKSWQEGRGDGLLWGEKVTPIERVGIYVPGGKAPLVSSLFMTAVPAVLAGVPRIVIATPPQKNGSVNPYLLAAADFLKIKEIYKIGGAQAIAALAFGTATVPPVDKIAGPGNVYVTLAKKEVFGFVDIDLLAGPSEVVILADGNADPRFIAADLLAQAEHGVGAISILITTSADVINRTRRQVAEMLPRLSRNDILRRNLSPGIFLIRVKNIQTGIELINRIAPEHLQLLVKKPRTALKRIRNAGAIFLGPFSPVAAGDYVAGPSHVLPTGGGARFFSPLSVGDFRKKSSLIKYSREALQNDLPALELISRLEGLDAHAFSARLRLEGGRVNKIRVFSEKKF